MALDPPTTIAQTMDDRPHVRVLWRPTSRSASPDAPPDEVQAPPDDVVQQPADTRPSDVVPSGGDDDAGDPAAGSSNVGAGKDQVSRAGFALPSAAPEVIPSSSANPAAQADKKPAKRRTLARPTRRLRSQRRRQTDRIDFTPVLPKPSPRRNPGATVQASSPIKPPIQQSSHRSAGQPLPAPEQASPSSSSHSPPPLPMSSLFLPRMVPASQCPSLDRARAHVHHSQAPALDARRTSQGSATHRSPPPTHSKAGLEHDTSRGFARPVRAARSARPSFGAPYPPSPIRAPPAPSEPQLTKKDAPPPPRDTASFVAYVNAHLFSGLDAPPKPKPVPQRHRRSPLTWTRSTTDPQVRFNASSNVSTGAETEPEPEPETEAEQEPESRTLPAKVSAPSESLERNVGRQDRAGGGAPSSEPGSPPTRTIRVRRCSSIDAPPPLSSSVTTLALISDVNRVDEGEAASTCRSPSLEPASSPPLLSPKRYMASHSPTSPWEPKSLASSQASQASQPPSQASQPTSQPTNQPGSPASQDPGARSVRAASQISATSSPPATSPRRTKQLVRTPRQLASKSSPALRPTQAVTPPRQPVSKSSPTQASGNSLGFTSVPRKSYARRTPSNSKRTPTTHGHTVSAPPERGIGYGAESSAMAGVLRMEPSQRKRRRSSVSPPLGPLKRTVPRVPTHGMGSSPGTAIVLSDDEDVEIVSILPPPSTAPSRSAEEGYDYDVDDPVFEAFSQALARHGI